MAEEANIFKLTSNSEDAENNSVTYSEDKRIQKRLSFSSGEEIKTLEEPSITRKDFTLQSVSNDSNTCSSTEVAEQLTPQVVNASVKAKSANDLKYLSPEHQLCSKELSVNNDEDKENTAMASTTIIPGR